MRNEELNYYKGKINADKSYEELLAENKRFSKEIDDLRWKANKK